MSGHTFASAWGPNCPIFWQLTKIRADQRWRAACKLAGKQGEILLIPSFIRLKRTQLGFSKKLSACGDADAL